MTSPVDTTCSNGGLASSYNIAYFSWTAILTYCYIGVGIVLFFIAWIAYPAVRPCRTHEELAGRSGGDTWEKSGNEMA